MTLGTIAATFRLDPQNPGQFFACCGLLELAQRAWKGAAGWFAPSGNEFHIAPTNPAQRQDPRELLSALSGCTIANDMTSQQIARRDELSSRSKEVKDNAALDAEKKRLDGLWREAAVLLGDPFSLRIDWFTDKRADGANFKTWAGQQSVIDIATGMQRPLVGQEWRVDSVADSLSARSVLEALPFNFDSDLGGLGSDRDVGFSFDPLKSIGITARPLLELCAFVGLQRFRPAKLEQKNRFAYALWTDPLVPAIASAAACGLVSPSTSRLFEFRLLYRTKYLKSFLPATPKPRR